MVNGWLKDYALLMKHYKTKPFMTKQLMESLLRWGLSYWLTTGWDVPYPVVFEKL
jgi:hypothetical protein